MYRSAFYSPYGKKVDPRTLRRRYISGGGIVQSFKRLGNKYVVTPAQRVLSGLEHKLADMAISKVTGALASQIPKALSSAFAGKSGGALHMGDPDAKRRARALISRMNARHGI